MPWNDVYVRQFANLTTIKYVGTKTVYESAVFNLADDGIRIIGEVI